MKYFFFTFCIGLIVGCNTSKPASGNAGEIEQLYMYRWELIELNGKPFEKTDQMDPHLVFSLDDHKVDGSPGCNHLSGSFKLSEDHRIKFSTMVTTKMACPDTRIEYDFLQVLGQADSWTIENTTLKLRTDDRLVAQFKGTKKTSGR